MRLTVLGHGALSVEAAGTRLLVDPWLSGSCYWRSWWHYPPTEVRPEDLAPDLVYLSHHHFDHFHYPSMRRIDRSATVLVPRFAVDVMPAEVRSLGFEHVVELPHGDVVEVAPGVRVASLQYGFDDSALLVESGGVVLADLNDCKVRGRALDELLSVFGRPTFLFKSHSWAQAYPVHYTAEDRAELTLVGRESYIADFEETVQLVRPDYAVPFASMVAFLHPETMDVNDQVVTPRQVADQVEVEGSEVVVMGPGESWSVADGFSFGDVDWFEPVHRKEALADLIAEVRPTIVRALDAEADVTVDWAEFRAYFESFVRSLPPFAARFLLPRPVTFDVPSGGATPAWTIDARRRRVTRAAAPPAGSASVITVPEAVLASAIRDRIVHFVHISLRLHVHLRRGGIDSDLGFWGLLSMWELGYLPLRSLPRRRLVSASWRRRRELWEMATTRLFGRGSIAARMTAGLITSGDEPAS